MDADGDFVVAWGSEGQDGDYTGVYAQRYDGGGGRAQGPEFRVNTFTTGSQLRPAVAVDDDGDFVVAWESQGPGRVSAYGDLRPARSRTPVVLDLDGNGSTERAPPTGSSSCAICSASIAVDADRRLVCRLERRGSGRQRRSRCIFGARFNSAPGALNINGDRPTVNTYTLEPPDTSHR